MSDENFARLWLTSHLKRMVDLRAHAALCLKHVKNTESSYAEGFRVMLRAYDGAIASAEAELAKL